MPEDVKVNRDLKKQAYDILREKLINCDYEPGSVLNESQLSLEFGLSRTPIREALSRLEQDGYIRILPKKGIYVTDVTLNDVMQIFQARIEMEPVTLMMAGPHLPECELLEFRSKFTGEEPDVRNGFRLDTAMHLFLIEHCGNRLMIDFMCKVFDGNTRVVIASKQNRVKIHDARQEHLEVLDLLLEKDYAGAAKSMRKHVESCRRAAMDYFYNQHTYNAVPAPIYKQELEKLTL
jgi:DNA-binding GntR family transcriptional regulator